MEPSGMYRIIRLDWIYDETMMMDSNFFYF
jgi:hypothetical protein